MSCCPKARNSALRAAPESSAARLQAARRPHDPATIFGPPMASPGFASQAVVMVTQTVNPLTMIKGALPNQFYSICQSDRMSRGSGT